MQIQHIKQFFINFQSKQKLIKSIIYLKLLEKDIKITDNDLNLLCLFVEGDNIKVVAEKAIELKYKQSLRSVENAVSDLVKSGLLCKLGTSLRTISETILPRIEANKIAVECKIHNLGS